MSDDLEGLLASALKIPRSRLTDDLEYGAIEQWDSLSHVNLMLSLEAAYDVEIDEDTMIELTSIAAIKDFVRSNA